MARQRPASEMGRILPTRRVLFRFKLSRMKPPKPNLLQSCGLKTFLQNIFVAGVLAIGNAFADSGYGRLDEAYGYIIGIYTSGLLIAEVCSEYPKLKEEAESTSRNYLSANTDLYSAVGKKMQNIALSKGGQPGLNRLRQEVQENLSD